MTVLDPTDRHLIAATQAGLPLTERVGRYGALGKAVVDGELTVDQAVTELRKG